MERVELSNMNWIEKEDKKYSELYESGYPSGNPEGMYNWSDPKVKSSERTLDLGCGLATLKTKFTDYVGVDVSEFVIERNKKKYPDTEFYHSSLDNLGFLQEEKFVNAFCCDVMEHIPEEYVGKVLFSISELNVCRYFFGISTRPSGILDSQGGNLHLTVQDFDWWNAELKEYFDVVRFKKLKDLIYFEVK